ncbi:DUF2794 domain-containing protein [Methylocapsa palsarum]|uniref:DUF2794 domain-containing protein n=1 Tax=Methylocapsa palsarum TaxID=1612308 RepID=UPI003CC7ADE6
MVEITPTRTNRAQIPAPISGPTPLAAQPAGSSASGTADNVVFDRGELREILNLYGRKVAAGEWRDYAIDFAPQKAVFSIFRRASEYALYRIEKNPKLARKQGAYAVVAASGLVLKRGHDLRRVMDVLDKRLKLISS